MARFGEKLKEIRLERNMTQDELAAILGTSKQVVSRYENNQRSPKVDVVQSYARALNVPIEYLLNNTTPVKSSETKPDLPSASNIIPMPTMRKIPLIGTIACGEPILAEENIECEVDIPDNIRADFALRCDGDSMIDVDIRSGDIVYIRKQDMVDNGQIAAVLIDETCDEARATLKRVYYDREIGEIRLVPENRREPTRVFSGEELNSIHILGLAVGLTRSLDGK